MKAVLQTIGLTLVICLAVGEGPYAQPRGSDSPKASAPYEEIEFEHLSLEHGLSQSQVTSIAQDQLGFLWFGTYDGLNRYDGYRFTIYKHDPADSSSISNNLVQALYAPRDGKAAVLWVGTSNGLNKLDLAKDTFTRYYPALWDDTYNSSSNSISAIVEDRFGALWIASYAGLTRFVPNLNSNETGTEEHTATQGSITRFLHDPLNPNTIRHDHVFAICEDRDTTQYAVWLGTGAGLDKLVLPLPTGQRGDEVASLPAKITHYLLASIYGDTTGSNRIKALYQDRAGFVWIGSDSGLHRFDPKTESFAQYKYSTPSPTGPSNLINAIHEDDAGILWICTNAGGLDRFDPCTGVFTHYRRDPGNPGSLYLDNLFTIFEDRAGIFWLGLNGGGVNKLNRKKHKFERLSRVPTNSSSLRPNRFVSVFKDRSGELWVGTNDGLTRIHRDEHNNRQFTHIDQYPKNQPGLPKHHIEWVKAIREDGFGNLWFAANGLSRINWDDPNQPRFIYYRRDPENPNGLIANDIGSMLVCNQNELWVGGYGGFSMLTIDEQGIAQFTNHRHEPDNPNSLSNSHVLALHQDGRGMIWIGTVRGLNRFDPVRKQFTRYFREPDNPNSLSDDWIQIIYEDTLIARNTLWIGTRNGLNRFDTKTETFTHYTEKNGLPNNIIAGILSDSKGNLWISTFHGLAKLVLSKAEGFDPRTGNIRNYHPSDGLQGYEFDQRSCFKGRDGTLYFGGADGLNIFHPDSIRDNPNVPPVVLTDLQIFNKSIKPRSEGPLKQSVSTTEQVTLSYKHSVFSFEFAALDYAAPEMNQYAYKLEGFNDDWIDLGNRRFVTFTNLDAGDYVLRVKGSNNDGVWNEEGASLKITITPPPWKTWWAYTLYAVFGLGLLYTIRRYEMNRLRLAQDLKLQRLEAQKLHEVDQIKSRFFANISHEFRTPLTLILGPLEQLLAKEFHGDPMQQYGFMHRSAKRLLHLINQLLDLSKLEEGSMPLRARPENLIHLLRIIIASFASLAERKKILLRLDTSALPKADRDEVEPLIVYLDRDKFEKCMNNLLSNAIKFTPSGGEVVVAVAEGRGLRAEGEGPGAKSRKRKNKKTVMEWQTKSSLPSALRPPLLALSSFIEISVRDTGIGIPADQLDKIFDRFYQVEENSSSPHAHKRQGTGIGLALTKELIELHRGEIHVESELGKGSTFTVRLLLGKDHLKPEEIVEEVTSDQSSVIGDLKSEERRVKGERRDSRIEEREYSFERQTISRHHTKIPSLQQSGDPLIQPSIDPSIQDPASSNDQPVLLIVEDNPDMRAHLRGLLDRSYRIIEAGDGTEGLEKSAEAIPDLIISDVMMPEMDGFEFCRRIKTDERTSHIPVILLTARASERSKLEGLETGADDYLTKPFNANELRVRANNLIEQRRQLRERFSREVTLQPKDIAITTADELFLQRVMAIVDEHLSDPDFSVEAFAQQFRMSRVQLHRKIKALTNQSPGEFIRTLRLRAAAKLLEQDKYTVTEVAYEVGFNNLSYFAKCFREQFGVLPSEYEACEQSGVSP
jgi:signal transduction histidine kinase/ligand-binding sensor domain-containing protein/DNA-binding response OmpR family regulator